MRASNIFNDRHASHYLGDKAVITALSRLKHLFPERNMEERGRAQLDDHLERHVGAAAGEDLREHEGADQTQTPT